MMEESASSEERPNVKIWSHNVFLRPPPIKNNNDDYKSERFGLFMDRIHKYDIVCFQ
jgi:hypothetical protein